MNYTVATLNLSQLCKPYPAFSEAVLISSRYAGPGSRRDKSKFFCDAGNADGSTVLTVGHDVSGNTRTHASSHARQDLLNHKLVAPQNSTKLNLHVLLGVLRSPRGAAGSRYC